MTICALTGYTPSDADRQRQQETGFDHYYVKPVDLKKLLELFEAWGPKDPATLRGRRLLSSVLFS